MKRTIALLWALILLFIPVSSFCDEPSPAFETAREIANFMETHYGITILIGPECVGATSSDIVLGDEPMGQTPLQQLLKAKPYDREIRMIDDAFSIYPPGFFDHFRCGEAPNGLRILLADQVIYDGTTVAGVTTDVDGYYNIFLGVGAIAKLNIHHELWHAAEFRILYDNPHAFDGWAEMNPEGFEYLEDYGALNAFTGLEDAGNHFARRYGTISEMEDRATVIEALFQKDEAWWDAHPVIREKYNRMTEAALPIFGEIYSGGE